MLTLFGTYLIAISVGAGCALINDLFFILTLKHHIVKRNEINILKQLNLIQVCLIIWIILCEIVFFSVQVQNFHFESMIGATVAKLLIELTVLFCAFLLKQMYLPQLIRHQHNYGHLSESFKEHSNSLIAACATSLVSWFFIILITSSAFNQAITDFGFTTTIVTYAAIALIANWFFIILKNKVLHRRKHN